MNLYYELQAYRLYLFCQNLMFESMQIKFLKNLIQSVNIFHLRSTDSIALRKGAIILKT